MGGAASHRLSIRGHCRCPMVRKTVGRRWTAIAIGLGADKGGLLFRDDLSYDPQATLQSGIAHEPGVFLKVARKCHGNAFAIANDLVVTA